MQYGMKGKGGEAWCRTLNLMWNWLVWLSDRTTQMFDHSETRRRREWEDQCLTWVWTLSESDWVQTFLPLGDKGRENTIEKKTQILKEKQWNKENWEDEEGGRSTETRLGKGMLSDCSTVSFNFLSFACSFSWFANQQSKKSGCRAS